MTRPNIEQPVKPGEVPQYAHPANMPQCMVHGHQPAKRAEDRPLALSTTTVHDPGNEHAYTVITRLCVMCGTVYGVIR